MSGSLSERLEQLRREMTSALEAAGREAVAEVLKTVTAIDDAGAQPDILQALLEGGARFASRAAFFLTRPGEIQGWASDGFGRSSQAIEGAQLEYGDDGPWAELARGGGAVFLSVDECAELCAQIDAAPGSDAVLIPFVLRGQLGGALYADRLSAEDRLDVASLQLLTHTAAQALETVAFRGGASPALRTSGEAAALPAAMPLWQAPAAPPEAEAAAETVEPPAEEAVAEPPAEEEAEPPAEEAVTEPPAEEVEEEAEPPAEEAVAAPEPEEEEPEVVEPEPEAEAEEPAELLEPAADLGFETAEGGELAPGIDELAEEPEPELEDTSADIWALEEDEEPTQVGVAPSPEPESAGAAPMPPEAVGQETVRLDIARLQGQEGTPLPADQEFRPPEPEPLGPEPVAPEPAPPAPAPDLSEEPTVISTEPSEPEPPPEVAPPPADEYPAAPPPEPEPEPRRETTPSGSTEVQPPMGLEGPGSAFVKTSPEEISEGEDALHEEARRLARLLVSEIKLYNEEIIEEGRRNSDIYDRLKDDIDRSRQMYEERIDPRLHGKEDYFHQELVQRLAGGDESLLGR